MLRASRRLAGSMSASTTPGAFARCAVKQAWERLLAREEQALDAETLDGLVAEFAASNYDYRVLIEKIANRPEYVFAGRYDGKENR
jgi:DNA-binding IscR family transcriptional regulator